jgi:hypothetical protein
MAPALEPPTPCERGPWSREAADAFTLASRAAGACRGATAATRRMKPAEDRTPGAQTPGRIGARGCDSERLSPGRDRRRHPRQVQRRGSCSRERKLTQPTDLAVGALRMQGAAPFSGGQPGARNPGGVERTGNDHAEGDKAHANDEMSDHRRLLFSLVRRVQPLVGHAPRPVQTRLAHGGAPRMIREGLDSTPPICTLAGFEVRAS